VLLVTVVCCFPASISTLNQQADVVVVGTAISLQQVGFEVTFDLQVSEVVKGQVAVGQVLSVGWTAPDSTSMLRSPSTWSRSGIWFLQSSGAGAWRSLSARPPGMFFDSLYYPIGAPAAAATSAAMATADPVETIIGRIAAANLGLPANQRPTVLSALGTDDSPAIRSLLRSLLTVSDGRLVCAGFQGLIERSDSAALEQFAQQRESLKTTLGIDGVVMAISAYYRNTDPAAMVTLGNLATTPSTVPRLQPYAVHALVAIHTKETLPYLASLLDSTDTAVVKEAVIGLGYFANGAGMQTVAGTPGLTHLNNRAPNAFTTPDTQKYFGFDPAKAAEYVAFWKSWWLAHKAELTQ
jgi:hypothetical protein